MELMITIFDKVHRTNSKLHGMSLLMGRQKHETDLYRNGSSHVVTFLLLTDVLLTVALYEGCRICPIQSQETENSEAPLNHD